MGRLQGILTGTPMPAPADILRHLSFAAIDFESAGAAPGETDQPVQIGIARIDGTAGAIRTWTSYIAVTRPVRWTASKIHGITTEMLAEAPPYISLWPPIKEHLEGTVAIGHNHSTEQRFLRQFPGHGFGPWLDTLALARACLPALPSHSLGAIASALGLTEQISAIVPGKTWHDALYDATASLCILLCLIRELQLEDAPLDRLGFALTF